MNTPPRYIKYSAIRIRGFTLAELLIALVILGVIATFTIPKVLQSQQDAKYKSLAKEAAAMVSGAYNAYQISNAPTASMNMQALTPFMNYVRVDTSMQLDHVQTLNAINCALVSNTCLHLHNGSVMLMSSGYTFGGTEKTSAILYYIDPDGKVTDGGSGDTSATASGKSV